MRAIMVMFDSLNRHMLPPYGSDEIIAPNFTRLAERTVALENFYAGSMPCMPARREIHTGRYNFLHRSWGPLEPFDDSMPELLKQAGVHTHLASDHPHYWEDGGATYHPRYSTWEFFRGQEGDPWKGVVDAAPVDGFKGAIMRQDAINRGYLQREAHHPQTQTFDAGLHFIESNLDADQWFVQIECFDPHEPFFSYDEYKKLYPHTYDGPEFDWPPYAKVTESEAQQEHARAEYKALVSMCDRSLGRVLDMMDENNLWDDTLLIVNTDHGFLLGEHGWWAKSVQPWFNELVHLPAFIWDPRTRAAGTRDDALVQTIDIAPTLLEFFAVDRTPDMLGTPISTSRASIPNPTSGTSIPNPTDAVNSTDAAGNADAAGRTAASEPDPDRDRTPRPNVREGALFGIHGGHVNVTDGRFVYMRACATPANEPLEEFTLMPTHMRGRFAPNEFADMELAEPFSFTKGIRTLRLTGRSQLNPYIFGTLLFDLQDDPAQEHPLDDPDEELRMLRLLARLLRENDAPASQFERLGVPIDGEPGPEHLLVAEQSALAAAAAAPLPPLASFPAGERSLATPVAELLADQRARTILDTYVPALTQSELLGMLGSTTLYELAATTALPAPVLRQIAEHLARL
ncbi:sulfatase [Microbacterium sp. MPKO10]|uniref:sulfatase n=1 Tax=Microbacterium sp. MPKO10 TaxID=2989818 RepID=UPI0022357ACC|nr:sulfatase [Microbacterium sp. MPKO10]MCW4458801.1 sulfatase [Microbacterium sp. MPKO10]